jgi:hypothetical protein
MQKATFDLLKFDLLTPTLLTRTIPDLKISFRTCHTTSGVATINNGTTFLSNCPTDRHLSLSNVSKNMMQKIVKLSTAKYVKTKFLTFYFPKQKCSAFLYFWYFWLSEVCWSRKPKD